MPAAPALPAPTPRTPTQLLLARGGDPFAQTLASLRSARQSVVELMGLLPPSQHRLARTFGGVLDVLDAAAAAVPQYPVTPPTAVELDRLSTLTFGEQTVVAGAPMGRVPVNLDHGTEPVYGFAPALSAATSYLRSATEALRLGAQRWGVQRLVQAGAVAHAAVAVDHLATTFAAAVWDYERPQMPALPPRTGRVELWPGPRATPQTRWARYARATFLLRRVELTTASGRELIGDITPIAYLMHVVPPSPASVVVPYAPSEAYGHVPLYDELGVIHFCGADGTSLGAIAVADWLPQPQLTVAQGSLLHPGEPLRAYDRLVWSLRAARIDAGAAVLGVPIRRGVLHPPTDLPAPQQPRVEIAARVIRPSPHLVPYAGWAATPNRALLRRQRRHRERQPDLGPSTVVTEPLRFAYPLLLWVGALGSGYLLEREWWVRFAIALALVAVAEPWVSWLVRRIGDRDGRRMVATYRPPRAPGQSRRFRRRATLRFDGSALGVRSSSGHEVWVPARNDPDHDVVGIHRISHNGHLWSLALVDAAGHWLLVLPADSWVPGGDLEPLAGFARAVGLRLGEENVKPPTIDDDVLRDGSPVTLVASQGPLTRGMVIAAIHALAAMMLTLPGSSTATIWTLTIATVALAPVTVRALWRAWGDRRGR